MRAHDSTIRWGEPAVAIGAITLFAVSKTLPAWAVSTLLLAQLVALVTWERGGRAHSTGEAAAAEAGDEKPPLRSPRDDGSS